MNARFGALFVFVLAGCGASSTSSPPASAPQDAGDASADVDAAPSCPSAHTVVLTRHAEKADDGADPSLSTDGKARAERLAKIVLPLGPTHLVATEYKRTQETLGPLARDTGLTVDVRAAKDTSALSKELAEAGAGSVTVVAGHSNTVPAIAAALGHDVGAIDESEFGRVFVVRFDCSDAGSSLTELRSD